MEKCDVPLKNITYPGEPIYKVIQFSKQNQQWARITKKTYTIGITNMIRVKVTQGGK